MKWESILSNSGKVPSYLQFGSTYEAYMYVYRIDFKYICTSFELTRLWYQPLIVVWWKAKIKEKHNMCFFRSFFYFFSIHACMMYEQNKNHIWERKRASVRSKPARNPFLFFTTTKETSNHLSNLVHERWKLHNPMTEDFHVVYWDLGWCICCLRMHMLSQNATRKNINLIEKNT